MIPTDTIDKLEETWSSISQLGAQLTESQWKTPTALPGWSVQDNLSHLVALERHLQGMPGTDHRAERPGYVRNDMGEQNEHEVDARRRLPGSDVLAEWNKVSAERVATLRTADDSYFDTPSWTPVGQGTIASFLTIRVLDAWLHEQDMRRALNIPGHLSGVAAEHTVDRLTLTLPIVVGKRAATPEGSAVRFEITGGVQRTVTIEVKGGRAAVVETPAAAPVATITCDTATFVALAAGRATADQMVGKITVQGDTALADRVLSGLNMMI